MTAIPADLPEIPWRPLPASIARRRVGVCVFNAMMDAREHALTPMVGWVCPAADWCDDQCIPLEHAWCVDSDGFVVDSSMTERGHRYRGWTVTTRQLLRLLPNTDPTPLVQELLAEHLAAR